MSMVRWKFHDTTNSDVVSLPLNPNQMSTPTTPRNMSWAAGVKVGLFSPRGIDNPMDNPTQWTFGGVILTQSHYELLLAWAQRLTILHVDDHLGRTFEIMIQKFDPVERLPTATQPWRVDYTMTCLLLKEI